MRGVLVALVLLAGLSLAVAWKHSRGELQAKMDYFLSLDITRNNTGHQKLPQINTENQATFPIQIRKIILHVCGNFWVTQYVKQSHLFLDIITVYQLIPIPINNRKMLNRDKLPIKQRQIDGQKDKQTNKQKRQRTIILTRRNP